MLDRAFSLVRHILRRERWSRVPCWVFAMSLALAPGTLATSLHITHESQHAATNSDIGILIALGLAAALAMFRQPDETYDKSPGATNDLDTECLECPMPVEATHAPKEPSRGWHRVVGYLMKKNELTHSHEDIYSRIFREASDGIFVADHELRMVDANEAFCRLWGMTREAILQLSLQEVLAGARCHQDDFCDLVSAAEFRGEMTVSDEAGKTRTVDLIAAPIGDGCYLGLARDITQRKLYENEMRRAAELRELLLRTMSDGLAVLDHEGHVLICNRATERLLSLSQTEIMQICFLKPESASAARNLQRWRILQPDGAQLSSEINPFHLALRSEQRVEDHRLKIVQPNGKEVFISINAAPLYDEHNQLIGALATLRDISHQHATEVFHTAPGFDLQQTARLATLGEFAAGVAHEINNLMTGMISYAQLLSEKVPAESEEMALIRGIFGEGDRLTGLIRNLLTFARQQPHEYALADLNELMQASLGLMAHQFRRDGIRIVREIPADLPPLRCHGQQIQQVFVNLLNNAHHALNLKFPEPNENKVLKICARAMSSADGSRRVRIEFHDRGIGIPADILPRIFDPFFTTKGRLEGTGLGLSISYGIVKEHGGGIWVESILDDHTLVAVELPAECVDWMEPESTTGKTKRSATIGGSALLGY